MSSIEHKIPTTTPLDRYVDEASQVILRALDGSGGTWERHGRGANLADMIGWSVNDNGRIQ
jgi:hypothetical protein